MCSIAGFYNCNKNLDDEYENNLELLESMNKLMVHRGPDADGVSCCKNCYLSHNRLSIRDIKNGSQPMVKYLHGNGVFIVYNGELYNHSELISGLNAKGCFLNSHSDTEVILSCFIKYGPDFVKMLRGIFAFAIYDEGTNSLYLYRDHFGVKPLYYSVLPDKTTVFASEIKSLLTHPHINPVVDRNGLCEIFGLGPSKTPGSGVFKQIQEVKPGHFIKFSPNGFFDFTYYRIESAPHLDDFQETVEKTRYLVSTSIKRQMVSDVPICTFLSGGIDSSIVSSICASELAKNSQILNTISFDFTGNDKYFTANAFQPEQDRPYVDTMIKYLGSNHTYLTCNYSDLADYLYASVKTRDLPTMADVDSSLLYFCGEVAKDFKVVLTGECADEIFGGYPWFYRDDLLQADTFPWMKDISPRLNVLNEDFANALHLEDYINNLYNSLLTEINLLPEESVSEKKRRQVAYLNIKMFMQTLLDRMDRTSMANSLEARVPFADPDVLDYVFNIPWDMKFYKNQEKGLLRFAMQDTVPEEIMYRKKSPYPKSYDPHYEKILTDSMRTLISDGSSPLLPLLDISYVNRYLDAPKDYGKPWFGQLMAGPQMIAYLLQVDYWMRTYNVKLEL